VTYFLVENLQGPCKSAAFSLMIDKPELMGSPLSIYTMKQCASRNTLAPPPITNNYSSAETKATSILKVQVQNDILEMIRSCIAAFGIPNLLEKIRCMNQFAK